MSEPTGATYYSYGDSAVAGDRLALLATIFEPTTATLLRDAVTGVPNLALDLGCGPGFTTRLIAATTGAARTVGLDFSGAFVARATDETGPRSDDGGEGALGEATAGGGVIEFVRHDITATPFPVGPADLIFARYLLAHLTDAATTVGAWATQLVAPGGRLLLEEIESIDTTVETFAQYLQIVIEMSRANGADLLIGPRLTDFVSSDRRVMLDRTVTISPAVGVVARMFAMNLSVWRHDPYARQHLDSSALDQLLSALDALATGDANADDAIVWTHRQIAIQRM